MDDSSALQLTVQQQSQRINALEELLRRNEGTVGAVLGRVKDIELGMNNFHKMIQHVVGENQALGKELAAAKQKADVVDRSWRTHVQQSETSLWGELRAIKPQPVAQDPTVQRLVQETTQQRSQLNDMEIGLNRLTDAQAADTNAIRICEQHIQSAEGQLSELVSLQRETAKDTVRRFEQVFRDVSTHRQDVDKGVNTLKTQSERQIREIASAMEQHSGAFSTFQQECGTAIRTVREEVSTGLSQAAQSLRENEEAAKTLEQILRAEVQTRANGAEQLARKFSAMEQAVVPRLGVVANHQTDIARLWDTIRTVSSQRSQAERLDSVLSSIHHHHQSPTPAAGAAAGAGVGGAVGVGGVNTSISAEQMRDLESATSERFEVMDAQVLQLAETLKRAHAGVEEQVDSLASRFGRMEMRLESLAARKEDSAAAMQARIAAAASANTSAAAGAGAAALADNAPTEVIVKELVDTRMRVDRLDANVEEVKFDVSDLLDAISAETSDLNRRLESLETHRPTQQQQQQQQQQPVVVATPVLTQGPPPLPRPSSNNSIHSRHSNSPDRSMQQQPLFGAGGADGIGGGIGGGGIGAPDTSGIGAIGGGGAGTSGGSSGRVSSPVLASGSGRNSARNNSGSGRNSGRVSAGSAGVADAVPAPDPAAAEMLQAFAEGEDAANL